VTNYAVSIDCRGGKFADGVSVGAYPTSNFPKPGQPSGAPIGSAADSVTVTDGFASFAALAEGTYWITDSTGSRYVKAHAVSNSPTFTNVHDGTTSDTLADRKVLGN
jgi:hypothetical protein